MQCFIYIVLYAFILCKVFFALYRQLPPPLTLGLKLKDGAGPSQAEHIKEADFFMVLLAENHDY